MPILPHWPMLIENEVLEMKKFFEVPELELLKFQTADVITTSFENDSDGDVVEDL